MRFDLRFDTAAIEQGLKRINDALGVFDSGWKGDYYRARRNVRKQADVAMEKVDAILWPNGRTEPDVQPTNANFDAFTMWHREFPPMDKDDQIAASLYGFGRLALERYAELMGKGTLLRSGFGIRDLKEGPPIVPKVGTNTPYADYEFKLPPGTVLKAGQTYYPAINFETMQAEAFTQQEIDRMRDKRHRERMQALIVTDDYAPKGSWFWRQVWNLSELTRIPLGRFAPWVFGKAIGAEGTKVDE